MHSDCYQAWDSAEGIEDLSKAQAVAEAEIDCLHWMDHERECEGGDVPHWFVGSKGSPDV